VELSREAPYHRFRDFIASGADRLEILCTLLDDARLPYQHAVIAGNRHVVVFPDDQGPAPGGRLFEAKVGQGAIWGPGLPVLVAHYDRAMNSPGANDNSAAVFQLIEAALRLREKNNKHWLIIFTDKEEIADGEGIREQGSYTLARALREAGLGGNRFYIFDACGVGDTLIISTMADHLMKEEEGMGIAKARQHVQILRNHALVTARRFPMEKVMLAPTPFSDDAGFLRAGIAAQTITVLPSAEATQLAALRLKPEFADALVSREAQDANSRRLIPETWRTLNSPSDSFLRLTPENFKFVVRFACELCRG
jgi:hypothetical protein